VEWIPVLIYGPVRDVIRAWPLEVKKELGSVLTRLQKGDAIRMEVGILLFHAFQKKSRSMPEREKKTAWNRLEDFLNELGEVPDETKKSKGR
jgi:phage-related protein